MVADLRKMQENQGVSENRIDKSGFVNLLIPCNTLRKIRIKDAINIIITPSINHLPLPD